MTETKKKTTKKKLEEVPEPTEQSQSINDKASKLAKLKEKAAKLAEGVIEEKVDLKKKVKGEEPEKDTLVPIEDYLKSSIHLGTRAITPDMKPFVYKRRADSLAVFNTSLLDDKIREAAEYLSKYPPEDIVLVCKRDAGHKAAELFAETTGIRTFTKKYPAGILTNPNLENFIEAELVFICDPWTDKAALEDARRIKIPILGVCDTNNYTIGVTKVLPGNNKSAKSLGMIFYLLAKLYLEKRKLKNEVPPIQEFIENWDNLTPPK
jgi:small subunit ribosomal protein S2